MQCVGLPSQQCRRWSCWGMVIKAQHSMPATPTPHPQARLCPPLPTDTGTALPGSAASQAQNSVSGSGAFWPSRAQMRSQEMHGVEGEGTAGPGEMAAVGKGWDRILHPESGDQLPLEQPGQLHLFPPVPIRASRRDPALQLRDQLGPGWEGFGQTPSAPGLLGGWLLCLTHLPKLSHGPPAGIPGARVSAA